MRKSLSTGHNAALMFPDQMDSSYNLTNSEHETIILCTQTLYNLHSMNTLQPNIVTLDNIIAGECELATSLLANRQEGARGAGPITSP